MTVIRVVLCELSPVLASASRQALDDLDDMTCVSEEALEAVRRELSSRRVDALLLGASSPSDIDRTAPLLDENPRLKIMCISPDGRKAVLQERRFDRTNIRNVDFASVFSVLRRACAAEKVG